MRYRYAYKSSDGVRHEAEMEAESREAVFETLRAQGVRPIKVVAGDGSKANGEEARPWRRRGLVWAALAGALGAAAVAVALSGVLGTRGGGEAMAGGGTHRSGAAAVEGGEVAASGGSAGAETARTAGRPDGRVAKPRARRQIGLAAIVAATPLDAIFAHPSEALLARFAEPGKAVAVDVSGDRELAEDFRDALEEPILITADDSAETAELKRIVAGLKEESKMMSASGRTFEEAIAYFVAQQEMEARYREAILSRDSSVEEKNRLLSAIGLETIPTAGD